MSTEKVIVAETKADESAAEIGRRAGSLTIGRADEPAHPASVADRESIDHVARRVDDALSTGARPPAGGVAECGTIMPAIVLDEVVAEKEICSGMSSGPATTRIRAGNDDHAIGIANDTKYGLAGSAFVRDVARGMEVARRMLTGIVLVDGSTVGGVARMPFGGARSCELGGVRGSAAIDAFNEFRWTAIEDSDQHHPI